MAATPTPESLLITVKEQTAVPLGIVIAGTVLALVIVLQPRMLGPVDSVLAFLDDRLGRWRGRVYEDNAIAALLLAPVFVILGVFGIFPLLYAVYMSLYNLAGAQPVYLGLENYREALTGSEFWNCFRVTVFYAIGTIPLALALSFVVALGLFRILRARGFFRTVYFLPYVTSAVAAAMVWRYILRPDDVGLANLLLGALGGEPKGWLLESRGVLYLVTGGLVGPSIGPSLALCCVILFDVWHSSGFMVVIFLAGLSSIPRELEEAARIDGAGPLQVLRRVTLPLLSPTAFFLATVSLIKSFQAFNSFYALTGTGRGPLDTTQNMTVYIFTNLYEYHRLGYGAAVATLLCLAIVLLTVLQWRVVGRKVYYE